MGKPPAERSEAEARLINALAWRADQEGQELITDLIRLLNRAESRGYMITGYITEGDDEHQVFEVTWHNGIGMREYKITRGTQEWESSGE